MKFNITATIVHHHYNHSDDEMKSLLKTIIKNQKTMGEQVTAANTRLDQIEEGLTNINADIVALQALAASYPNGATAEEMAQLNSRISSIAERTALIAGLTPEAPVEPAP